MPATTDTRNVKALKQQLSLQSEQIGRLKSRIGTLVDELAVMEKDISRFKKQVSFDIKMLVERMNK